MRLKAPFRLLKGEKVTREVGIYSSPLSRVKMPKQKDGQVLPPPGWVLSNVLSTLVPASPRLASPQPATRSDSTKAALFCPAGAAFLPRMALFCLMAT